MRSGSSRCLSTLTEVQRLTTMSSRLQDVLGKVSLGSLDWDEDIRRMGRIVNTRTIKSLGFSPFEISHGTSPRPIAPRL